jgi:hypothetical protein
MHAMVVFHGNGRVQLFEGSNAAYEEYALSLKGGENVYGGVVCKQIRE